MRSMVKDLLWEIGELFICLWPLLIPVLILRWIRHDFRPLYRSRLWNFWFASWLVWLFFLTHYGFYLLWWGSYDWIYVILRLIKYLPLVLFLLRVRSHRRWLSFLIKFPWVVVWQIVYYWLTNLLVNFLLVVLLGLAFCC